MSPYIQRIAELHTASKRRRLNDGEVKEFTQALDLLTKEAWELAYLENLSLIASMVSDVNWHHEICRAIETLDDTKKPGHLGTD